MLTEKIAAIFHDLVKLMFKTSPKKEVYIHVCTVRAWIFVNNATSNRSYLWVCLKEYGDQL